MCCLLSRIFSFTTINVLINNSTYADFRGKVNGLGQVFAAIARFVGPSMGSNIFAWSISKERPWPFNYALTYHLLGLVMIGVSFYVYLLPKSINHSKGKVIDHYKNREEELKIITDDSKSPKEITNDMTSLKTSPIVNTTTAEDTVVVPEKVDEKKETPIIDLEKEVTSTSEEKTTLEQSSTTDEKNT